VKRAAADASKLNDLSRCTRRECTPIIHLFSDEKDSPKTIKRVQFSAGGALASERARGETGLQLQQRHYLQAVKGNLMLLTQLCHIHKNASTQRACRCTFFSLRIPILYVWRIGEIDRFCVCCCRAPAQARQHLRWALRDCTIRVPDPTRTDSISTIAN
jgi:hypothetical protein